MHAISTKMHAFSIVIPTYNRGQYIIETIQSALRQDFVDFEIIVVDDGSTDNTKKIIQDTFSRDSRVQYFYQENAERGKARNSGIQKASGQYIVFLDSDDTLHSDHLSTLAEMIKNNPATDFFATKYYMVRNGERNKPDASKIITGFYDFTFFLKGNPIGVLFCIKKNTAVHPFVEERKYAGMEDWMFLLQNLYRNTILVGDHFTISVNDHDDRSMRNNKDIIQKRIMANDWIKENIKMPEDQVKILDGYSYLFCAIHSYADNDRGSALTYLKKSIGKTGISKEAALLFVKILLGYNFIQRLK